MVWISFRTMFVAIVCAFLILIVIFFFSKSPVAQGHRACVVQPEAYSAGWVVVGSVPEVDDVVELSTGWLA